MDRSASRNIVLLLCGVVAGLLAHGAAAQDPVTTLKVNSRIVVLDVTVTDKAGHLVENLKQDDFTVLEDKVQQTLRSLICDGER